jgi:DoxX-like protein
MANTTGNNRARSLAGSILILLPGLALGISGIAKLAHVPQVVHQMAVAGFTGEKLMLVAVLEILSSVLFLYPKTRSFGLMFLSAFLGGAICVHVQMGEMQKAAGPAMFLTFSWMGAWLRHPQTYWSFRTETAGQNLAAERGEARFASREA